MPVIECQEGARATGQLFHFGPFSSPGLPEGHRLSVYLPPGYDRSVQDYSLALFFDGQNLFDDFGSFRGGWQLHRLLDYRACRHQRVPIVAAIHTDGASRSSILAPWSVDGESPARGDAMLEWVVRWVIPTLRSELRVRPGPEGLLIGGSSLGGLLSLYGFFRHPDQFGRVIAMSPTLGVSGGHHGPIYDFVAGAAREGGKIYLDAGGLECPCGHVLTHAEEMAVILARKGYQPGRNLLWHPDPQGTHDEDHWRRRLPAAVDFMCH